MQVELLDLSKPPVAARALELQRLAFPSFPEEWFQHILRQSHPATCMFGAYVDGQLAAVNAFIAHEVEKNGEAGLAYQSCMSATDPAFAGRGLFTGIINHAKHGLKDKGGAFIFGYPNHKSGPIFTGKLGFSVSPCAVAYIPAVGVGDYRLTLVSSKGLCTRLFSDRSIQFNARATAEWKRQRPYKLFEFEMFTNFLFGRLVEKPTRAGRVKMLQIGGYEINKPLIFSKLLARAVHDSGAHVARIVSSSASPLVQSSAFRRVNPKTEPIIAFPLKWEVNAAELHAWTGLKDVY